MKYLKLNFVSYIWLPLTTIFLAGLAHSLLPATTLLASTPEPPTATSTPEALPPLPPLETSAMPVTTFSPMNNYLANPGIGWQEASNFNQPLLPETTAYRRPQYNWRMQNPAENVFDWSKVDADIQTAIQAGKQLSFRIYTMRGESLGGHQVPQWVLNKGAVILPSGEPDYSNCVYQADWSKFVEAMRQKYDGHTNIAFIDISGYGNFNEWSWQDQTDTTESSLDVQARRRLADMFIGGSGAVQCRTADGQIQTASYDYTGFQSTQLLMPFAGIAQSSRYVAGRRADVGFRHDCLGSASHTNFMTSKVGDIIAQIWRKVPIVFEFCTGSTSDQTFISNADYVLKLAHASVVHDNLVGERSPTVLATLLNFIGYRFALQQISHPLYIESGDDFSLSMTWANTGYAPAYPKMGQDFELHFYLMNGNDVFKDWVINTDIANWMPAHPLPGTPPPQVINQPLRFPASHHSRIYLAKVAIINKRTGKAINLALNTLADAQGRYLVGAMIVPGPDLKSVSMPIIMK